MKLWLGALLVYATLSAVFLIKPEFLTRIRMSEDASPYVAAVLGPPLLLGGGAEAFGVFGFATSLLFGLLGLAHFLWDARPYSEAFAFPLAAAAFVWLFFGWLVWLGTV
jgi:hypothetical protein